MGATTDNAYCPNCGQITCPASCYYSSSNSDEPETVNRPKTVNETGAVVEGVNFFSIFLGICAIVIVLLIIWAGLFRGH